MPDNPKINFCPLCGTKVSPTDKICTNCEYDLIDYQSSIIKSRIQSTVNTKQLATDVDSTRNTTTNTEKKSSTSFIVIGVLIIIAFANYIFSNSSSDPPNNSTIENKSATTRESTSTTNPTSNPAIETKPESVKPEEVPKEIPKSEVIPALGENWIKDENTGIYLWNPYPTDNESISWSGSYVQDGDYRYAEGVGTVTWYKNGELNGFEEGTFEHGKPHGHNVYKFPDGRVKETDWNHGEEIQSDKAPTKSAEEDARQAFIHYHQAITDQNYSEAYSMLSSEQKQRVGDFNSYSSGYTNTISSTVEDLTLVTSDTNSFTFKYKLVARDKQENSIKAQLFNGQVTMIFKDNRWVIASARSQKSDEWLESNKIHRRN